MANFRDLLTNSMNNMSTYTKSYIIVVTLHACWLTGSLKITSDLYKSIYNCVQQEIFVSFYLLLTHIHSNDVYIADDEWELS